MAQSSLLSTLLRRCLSSQNLIFLRATGPLFMSHAFTTKHFSSLSSAQTDASKNLSDSKPSALSARMSFVFDQIDAIERERSQKDETLQRIRAWRQSKKSKSNQVHDASVAGAGELKPGELSSVETESGELQANEGKEERGGLLNREVELVHPWPEWIELMERLVQQNYFDHRRKDEDKMVEDLGFQMSEVVEEGFDFIRDWKTVQTACLNFGRDRFDILRALSRQDIQILVGYGCPSADKKVVFSAKLLRKHVHLDEGDVCSSCSLRHSCERAYLLTNKEDEARTIDVMRVLLTYGFDPLNGSVVNDSLLKIKSVKIVVRKLLHEVVKLSAVPIDPNLPPPIIKKPQPKVKQPPPPPKKRVGRDDIEMKKGDWLCPKCDFMNFAKNTVCLQCDAKRPKRQLLPGEWECPQCNFLNYRRNTVCFHCEHKRPPDEFTESQLQDRQRGSKTRLQKVSNRADVSNAWNFDFDDNESDGADVAAFEYADSQKLNEDFPLHIRSQREDVEGPADDSYMFNRTPRAHEREYHDPGEKKPGTGFDDFYDEEDDIDSYELDVQNNNQPQKSSSIDFSEVVGHSESEDVEGFDEDRVSHRTSPWSRNKPSKLIQGKSSFSGSEVDEQYFDSDTELPVHTNWKSSHVADSRLRTRGSEALSFGSDEDYGLGSDSDDFIDSDSGSRKNKGNKWVPSSRDSRKRQIPDGDFGGFSLESDDEDTPAPRGRLGGSKGGPNKRGNASKGRGTFKSYGDSRFGSNGRNQFTRDFDTSSPGSRFGSNGRNQFNHDFNRSSQGPRASRGFRRDGNDGRRMNDGWNDLQNFKGRSREGFGNRRRGRFSDSYNRSNMDRDFDDDRPRRPRINVR